MPRTYDAAFFGCPICGKKPYVRIYSENSAGAHCKGFGFHRHKEITVYVRDARKDELIKSVAQLWNQMQYKQSRNLFYPNGDFMLGRANALISVGDYDQPRR